MQKQSLDFETGLTCITGKTDGMHTTDTGYGSTSFIELLGHRCVGVSPTPPELPDDYSEREPPDPIPNSEVKRSIADDSVELLHVKVGHCQALIPKTA